MRWEGPAPQRKGKLTAARPHRRGSAYRLLTRLWVARTSGLHAGVGRTPCVHSVGPKHRTWVVRRFGSMESINTVLACLLACGTRSKFIDTENVQIRYDCTPRK